MFRTILVLHQGSDTNDSHDSDTNNCDTNNCH